MSEAVDDDVIKRAEAILRPYLTSGAVFGITASHQFRDNIDGLPFRLVDDISKALAAERARCAILAEQFGQAGHDIAHEIRSMGDKSN